MVDVTCALCIVGLNAFIVVAEEERKTLGLTMVLREGSPASVQYSCR